MMRHNPAGVARQRGAFAIMAVLLLLVVVAVAIRYLLSAAQTTTYATAVESQSVEALMLAESGLERARGMLLSASQSGSLSITTCSSNPGGIGAGGPFPLGSGEFKYLEFFWDPGVSCTVTVVGKVGSATRTVTGKGAYRLESGVAGHDYKFSLDLKTTAAKSLVFTNIAYLSDLGNVTVIPCASPAIDCTGGQTVVWNDQAAGGQTAGNGAGLYALITGSGISTKVGGVIAKKSGSDAGKYGNGSATAGTDGSSAGIDTREDFGMIGVIVDGDSSLGLPTNYWAEVTSPGYGSGGSVNKNFGKFCDPAGGVSNTLLIGIAGTLKDPDATARVTSVTLASSGGGTTSAFTSLGHITSPGGTLFSEIWALRDTSAQGVNNYTWCGGSNNNNCNTVTANYLAGPTSQVKWVVGLMCARGSTALPRELSNFLVGQTTWWEPF